MSNGFLCEKIVSLFSKTSRKYNFVENSLLLIKNKSLFLRKSVYKMYFVKQNLMNSQQEKERKSSWRTFIKRIFEKEDTF